VSLDIGYPLDQIIHYKGTADKLLTESLQCTLWLLVSKGVRQNLVEMATVRIPLKQVDSLAARLCRGYDSTSLMHRFLSRERFSVIWPIFREDHF